MPFLTNDLTIAPGQNVSFTTPGDTGSWGYQVQGSASFTNGGTVNVTGDTTANPGNVIGFYQPFGNGQNTLFWNQTGATFRVTATGADGDAFGIRGGGFMADITNNGLIEVTAARGAFGIYGSDTSLVVNNTGTLRVTAGGNALGIGFHGTVNNSGEIDVSGQSAIGVNLQDASAHLTNSGVITATSTGPAASIGVALTNATGSTLTVTNTSTGTIEGDFAFREIQIFATPQLGQQVIENAGLADGAIDLGLGNDELHNTGSITDYVALGQGADHYYGGGALFGPLFGGFGNDTVTGGADQEIFFGEEGNDVIDGGGGADIIDGGHDNDTLTGGGAADQLYGGYGDDIIQGGDGDDELDGWAGSDTLQGDAGVDTIVISNAAFSTGAGFDTAIGFDFAQDKIRVETAPTTINTTIASGSLSQATFGADLAAAASASALSAKGAVLFNPTAGGFAGSTFLIVDANNIAGYQDGADIVIRLTTPENLNALSLSTFVAGASTYEPLPLEFTSSPLYGEGREIHGDFTIHQDETLQLDLQGESIGVAAVNLNFMPALTVTNAGLVAVHSTAGNPQIDGISATEDANNFDLKLINTAGATFLVEADSPTGSVNVRGAFVRQFQNDGSFEAISTGQSTGVSILDGSNSSFINTGTFHVSAGASAVGVAIGDNSFKTSIFENSGDILVEAGATAGFAEAVDIVGLTATFKNSGTIRVIETSSTTEGVAIAYANSGNPFGIIQTFENSGLIEADYAIRELNLFSQQVTREVVVNTGIIHGKVSLGAGNDEIRNSNQMVGAVDLGAGNDVYDGTQGSLVGLLSGGDGNDTIAGGNGAETFSGGNGTDFIQGRGGNDVIDGGADTDTADYSTTTLGVVVDLTAGTATGSESGADQLISIENANGGAGNDDLTGTAGDNVLAGNGGNDLFRLYGGGTDAASGGDGNDSFLFGGTFTAADSVDGGSGSDTVNLNGNYAAGVTFAATTMVNVESLYVSAGNSYRLTTNDANVAAGQTLVVYGADLLAGNALTFDGSADSNGKFNLIGGAGADDLMGAGGNDSYTGNGGNDTFRLYSGGVDTASGGDGNDSFLFGGTFTAADTVDGGNGSDTLNLNGTYAALVFGATTMTNVESLYLSPGGNYNLTLVDANVAAGQNLLVYGADLSVANSLVFNGSAESNGAFTIRGGAGADDLMGGAGNDSYFGNGGNDLFRLYNGGVDTASGGDGNDSFLFGGTLTAADSIDGGNGSDTVNLNGNYASGIVFGATTMTNVESLYLTPGGNYNLTTNEATVAAGQNLLVYGQDLTAANSLVFNGSAESNGAFTIRGGAGADDVMGGNGNDSYFGNGGGDLFRLYNGGVDNASGGDGNDSFLFGGTLTAADGVDGGNGSDTVNLNGNYSAGVAFTAATMTNVEALYLTSGGSYNLTTADATVGAGQSLLVYGSDLSASSSLVFNGSAETNGSFTIRGGAAADTLTGGSLNDTIAGNGGADSITGGAGADRFFYNTVSDSTGAGFDTVSGFDADEDAFDFSFTVANVDAAVSTGALDQATFDSDLGTAIGAGQLAAQDAVLFTADAGSFVGQTFLIVDANGVAGYQAGADFVFKLDQNPDLVNLGTGDFV